MPVTAENKEFAQLQKLIPLNTLEKDNLLKLLGSVNVESVSKGNTLFSEGDVDHDAAQLRRVETQRDAFAVARRGDGGGVR